MENGHTFTLHRPDNTEMVILSRFSDEEVKGSETNLEEKQAFLKILATIKWDNEDIVKEVMESLEFLTFSKKLIANSLNRIHIDSKENHAIQVINIHCPKIHKINTTNIKLLLIMVPLNNYARIRLIKHFYTRQWNKRYYSENEKSGIYNMREFLDDPYQRFPPPIGKLAKAITYQIRDFYQNLKLRETSLNFMNYQMQLVGDQDSFKRKTLILSIDVPQICAANIAFSLYTLLNQNYHQELSVDQTLKFKICSISNAEQDKVDNDCDIRMMNYQMENAMMQEEQSSDIMY